MLTERSVLATGSAGFIGSRQHVYFALWIEVDEIYDRGWLIIQLPLPPDAPKQWQPDTSSAYHQFDWKPRKVTKRKSKDPFAQVNLLEVGRPSRLVVRI